MLQTGHKPAELAKLTRQRRAPLPRSMVGNQLLDSCRWLFILVKRHFAAQLRPCVSFRNGRIAQSDQLEAERYLKQELGNVLRKGTPKRRRPGSQYVHRLVVEVFIGEIPSSQSHLWREDKNSLEGLQVITNAMNTKQAWETGL